MGGCSASKLRKSLNFHVQDLDEQKRIELLNAQESKKVYQFDANKIKEYFLGNALVNGFLSERGLKDSEIDEIINAMKMVNMEPTAKITEICKWWRFSLIFPNNFLDSPSDYLYILGDGDVAENDINNSVVKRYKQGDVFGELGFFSDTTRKTYFQTGNHPTIIHQINREDMNKIVTTNKIHEKLSDIPILSTLSDIEFVKLQKYITKKQYNDGT